MGTRSNRIRSGDSPGVAQKVLSWKIRTSQNGQSLRLAFLDVKKLPVGRRTMPVGPRLSSPTSLVIEGLLVRLGRGRAGFNLQIGESKIIALDGRDESCFPEELTTSLSEVLQC